MDQSHANASASGKRRPFEDDSVEMKLAAVVLWTIFLLLVLLAPISEGAVPSALRFPNFDKVAHFGLFAVTGFIGVLGTSFGGRLKNRILFSTVFGLFLAVTTELVQSFTTRTSDLYDLLADVGGLLAGLVLYYILYNLKSVRSCLRL